MPIKEVYPIRRKFMPTQTEIEKPDEPKTRPGRKKNIRPILILAAVVIVVVILGFIATRFIGNTTSFGDGDYQAVFLINGQVYFGRVSKETKDQVVLKNIYYLRATEPLQQGEQAAGQPGSELSLIKLGNELHGPTDEMRIVRNNILFIEDLKDDSKVTIAIEEYITNQEEDQVD